MLGIVTDQDTKTQSAGKQKPGPIPERLKIEGDPEEGLKKLLRISEPSRKNFNFDQGVS